MLVTIVIPVFHDTEALTRTLDAADFGDAQVVVAATPDDRASLTALRAARPGVGWIETERGRARQMNAGAACADGRWLIFLHADTRLPAEWCKSIECADSDPRVDAGCFRFALDSASAVARVIELGVRLRVRVFSLPYGDQAIFVRRDRFHAVGGYADVPIMEDVDLVRRLGRGRARGWLFRARFRAVTSARRWERDGWASRTCRHLLMILLYFAGIPPQRLLWLDPARRDHPNPSGRRMSV